MGPSDKEVQEEEEKREEDGGRDLPLKKEGSSKQASIQADSAYSSTYSSLNSISSSGQRHAATPQKEAKGSHAALDRSHEKTEHAEEGYKNQKTDPRNSRVVFMA